MSQIAKTVLPLVACLFTTGENLRAIDDYDFFEKKIRPILVKHCYKCHSEESEKKKKRARAPAHGLRGRNFWKNHDCAPAQFNSFG